MIIGGRVTRVGGSGSSGSSAPALNNSSSESEVFLGLPILYWLIIAVIVIAGGILVYVFA